MPRRLAVLAIVATAVTAALQPATHASASPRNQVRAAGPFASSALTASEQIGTRPTQPVINVVTGRAMTPTEAADANLADGQANAAINEITASKLAANPLAAIPTDFSQVMGYQPTVAHLANGEAIAVNPQGGCSVIGGGRPFDLDIPCKAHDLGYDLLRYAHRHGQDLAPRARQRVDAMFAHDMSVQCAASYREPAEQACQVMAVSFDAGVGFNSWRQGFGAPIAAAGLVRTVGLFALAALAVFFALRGLTIWSLRRVRVRRHLRIRAARLAALPKPPSSVASG